MKLINDETIEDDIKKKLPFNLQSIHKIIRVSVSLENLSSLQSDLSLLKKAKLLPSEFSPCSTFSLPDFELLFDILDHPVQIIHYLKRRIQVDNNFVGDEMDFLGYYMTTLFNTPPINSSKKDVVISINGFSEKIDKYYMTIEHDKNIAKPAPKISFLFKNIFEKLEERSVPRWTEIGVILNMFSPSEQQKISQKVNKQIKYVHKNWKKERHKNLLIYKPYSNSQFSFAYVLYKEGNKYKRDDFIEEASIQALKFDHVKTCVLIARNIDKNDSPYHFIALAAEPKKTLS